jgi:hypothetical protein
MHVLRYQRSTGNAGVPEASIGKQQPRADSADVIIQAKGEQRLRPVGGLDAKVVIHQNKRFRFRPFPGDIHLGCVVKAFPRASLGHNPLQAKGQAWSAYAAPSSQSSTTRMFRRCIGQVLEHRLLNKPTMWGSLAPQFAFSGPGPGFWQVGMTTVTVG